MKYIPVYRCTLCNKLFQFGNEFEAEYHELPKLLGKCVQNQQFVGNPNLHKVPMQVVCKCSDGSAGLAQFAGFAKCDPSESKAAMFLTKLIGGGHKR